jgi:outer membrane protein TolC
VPKCKRVRSAELSYSSVIGERLPSFVEQGDTGLIGNSWNNSLDTYNMALLLQIPLFDGGQREGRISAARSQLRQEGFRMQAVLNQVRAEVNEGPHRVSVGEREGGAGTVWVAGGDERDGLD